MVTHALQTPIIPPSMIKSTVNRSLGSDPLDTLIGPYYITQYTERSLQQDVEPLKRYKVVLSRVYPTQHVAVDWEILGRPWQSDAKRRWCHARGWAYVTVGAKERLTPEDFARRLADERKAVTSATPAPTPAPELHDIDTLMARPETATGLSAKALAQVRFSHPGLRGKPAMQLHQRALSALTDALRVGLTDGSIHRAPEAVDAWLAAPAPTAG
jgi:hypothetical protein